MIILRTLHVVGNCFGRLILLAYTSERKTVTKGGCARGLTHAYGCRLCSA
ncbi:hypothetical protein HanXRQr2_Chr01g0003281 [Helianthus annuus]|uniref:Uncharacterized protein n=1 Tax=Helianthus annuus TaxID=4232 RepID=A0A9K3NRC3_HELAN|nr:hypothetical protein HanXRQr2_Chr04g0167381 [Helianthus annuus]KAF5820532.1 hypothetical protein HanXRQr2_Chr01g0003281 [Helianthus annuus]